MDNALLLAPGDLVLANGSHYHVQRFGNPSHPPLVLECGLTLMSSCWGWLAPQLAKDRHVIAYDRAGLGWSDDREGLRNAEQIGAELLGLLEALQLRPPFVLVGHSMGAIFNRALYLLESGLVSAMIWLDPAHPSVLPASRRMRSMFLTLEFENLLARGNLPAMSPRMTPHLRGLPEPNYRAIRFFHGNPRHLRTSAREARSWKLSADFVRDNALGSIPLMILSAQKNSLRHWPRYQQELTGLSSNCRHVTYTEMSHLSMLADPAHSARVAAEIIAFLAQN